VNRTNSNLSAAIIKPKGCRVNRANSNLSAAIIIPKGCRVNGINLLNQRVVE
jgi:hypothetical protein